jgi:splicing factor 3A subunit 1
VATIGPGIGPSATPAPISLPPPPASLPMNPNTLVGETAYAPPTSSNQPPSSASIFSLVPGQQQPVVLPPLHYQGLSSLPFSYTPPATGSPSRGTPTGTKPSTGVAGTVRSAEEMLEGDPSGGPVHKRPRVGRMPDGSLYPEDTWLSYNPVSFHHFPNNMDTTDNFIQDPVTINVRLPTYSDKPEWKLDGSLVAVPEVPLTALVSVLRDKLIGQIDSKVALSRVRLQMGTTTLTNGKTLASYNVMDGEEITFELRDVKKK